MSEAVVEFIQIGIAGLLVGGAVYAVATKQEAHRIAWACGWATIGVLCAIL